MPILPHSQLILFQLSFPFPIHASYNVCEVNSTPFCTLQVKAVSNNYFVHVVELLTHCNPPALYIVIIMAVIVEFILCKGGYHFSS